MMGAERRSMIISEKDKKITAWHEAGHALVAKLTEHNDPVHKVTIIPRGPALGLTQMLPKEDRLNWNRRSVLDRIAMSMGGRIAEELEFNEITSGAKSDIEHATKFARSMVCEWGMSDKLGPLAFGEEENECSSAASSPSGRGTSRRRRPSRSTLRCARSSPSSTRGPSSS